MSAYDIALLWGGLALVAGVLSGYGAFIDRLSYWFAALFLLGGGGLVYYAYTLNDNVLKFSDFPVALYRSIGAILN